MKNPMKSWPNTEREKIAKEIQRLFSLQDKPLPEEKKNLLIDELELCEYPSGAVIAGIRSLVDEDLRSIKFITLKNAARRFITQGIDNYFCIHCDGHGVVKMRADGPLYPHDTCLACICSRGQILASANGILRWNGEKEQMNGPFKIKIGWR